MPFYRDNSPLYELTFGTAVVGLAWSRACVALLAI